MEFTHHDETAKLVNQQHGGDSDEGSSDGEEKQQGKDLRLRAKGRRKIKIEFIPEKTRRQITFSKRKSGLMKKVYELTTLTGTQALLLLASETGHVYSFATPKLQSIITGEEGKNLIQTCLSTPSLETDPQYQQGPTTTVLSGPSRSNTNQSTAQTGHAESDSPPMSKSPPHAPRGKSSYKASPGKSSPGHSVAPSPPGHESVSPSSQAGTMPSPQLGPGATSGPGSAVPSHFQQLHGYESFTRPPRPEDLKGLPGNYMPYFGQPGQNMPPQFTERQGPVKLEHEQANMGQSSPQQQRFAREYSPEQPVPGKDESNEQPHVQPLWNLYGAAPMPPHVQQQMNMTRGMAPAPHLAPHLAGTMKQPQSLDNFPGFPLMANPGMSPEMYQHHQQMQQMQHQIQMQQFQQMQMQEAQRNQQRK